MPVSFHLYKFLDAIPVAKTWKKAKCPSTNKWIKKTWYIYTMEYYAAKEMNKMPFAAT